MFSDNFECFAFSVLCDTANVFSQFSTSYTYSTRNCCTKNYNSWQECCLNYRLSRIIPIVFLQSGFP